MTAEECIDSITKVLSRDISISDGPNFHIDGSSITIVYGKDALDRLFEISGIISEYKKGK